MVAESVDMVDDLDSDPLLTAPVLLHAHSSDELSNDSSTTIYGHPLGPSEVTSQAPATCHPHQVQAESQAIQWLLELGAGELPHGLTALVQGKANLAPTCHQGTQHECWGSLLIWDTHASTFCAASLPPSLTCRPRPYLVSATPAASLVQQQEQELVPGMQPDESGLGSQDDFQSAVEDQDEYSVHMGVHVLLHASQSLVVRPDAEPAKGLLNTSPDGADPIYLSMVLGTLPVSCKVISTHVAAQLPAEADRHWALVVAVKVSAKVPADEAQTIPATLWAQLWYSDLLVSCLPVLLYTSAPASPTDMRAMVEINAWAGCAYQEEINSIQSMAGPKPDPGLHLINAALSSGSFSGEDLFARGMADLHAAFPAQTGTHAVVQLQQPHPILGFQCQELALCLQPTAASPAAQVSSTSTSSAGTAATSTRVQQDPQLCGGHEGNMSNNAHASSLVRFLADLGVWRMYASRTHAAQVPLTYAATQPLPYEAAEGSQPVPTSRSISGTFQGSSPGGTGDISRQLAEVPSLPEDALRLRMVLMGLSLLRCAVQCGMRGVAAGILAQLMEQPHGKALSTLLAAVNEAPANRRHRVEIDIACLLTGHNSRRRPSAELSALLSKHASAAPGAALPLPAPLPALVNTDGRTFLHLAVQSGSMAMVMDVLSWSHTAPGCLLEPGGWKSVDLQGMTPLHRAACLQDGGALASRLLAEYAETRTLWHMSRSPSLLTPAQMSLPAARA